MNISKSPTPARIARAVPGTAPSAMACAVLRASLVAVFCAVFWTGPVAGQEPAGIVRVQKDVPYVPTPDKVVDKMLDMAKVGKRDIVYDLGSGDGRIVIAAALRGARAVGVDIDPQRIDESVANAEAAEVTERVQFVNGDLFDVDLSQATVVTLYLLPDVNMRLRPKLLDELKPGTRVVSHSFDMGDWKPSKTATVGGSRVYYWTVP